MIRLMNAAGRYLTSYGVGTSARYRALVGACLLGLLTWGSVFTLGKQYRPGVNQADELGFDRREFVFAWVRLVSSVLTACT